MPEGAAAVAERPRREPSASFEVEIKDEAIRHHFVEIRDATDEHRLVTLIEILSPSNKRAGPDRDAYARKHARSSRAVPASSRSTCSAPAVASCPMTGSPTTSTGGSRVPPTSSSSARRGRRKEVGYGYRIYPIGLREGLPCVGVPLKAEIPDVLLDLQYAFDRLYDEGPYRRAVDYARPPDPPLLGEEAAWAEELLREPAGS